MMLVVATVVLLLFAALFSGFETGLYVCDKFKAQGRSKAGYFGARSLVWLLENRGQVVVALLIMTNICLFFASTCFTQILLHLGMKDPLHTALLSTALFSPIVVIFAEMVPKDVFRLRSDPLLYRFSPVVLAVNWLLRTVLWFPLRLLSRRRMHASLMTRDEMEFHLTQHLRRGSLLASMAANILRIGEKNLSDVMIPRQDCVTVTPESTIETVISLARKHRYSRMPVVDPKNRTCVVGVLNIFDMFYKEAEKVKDVMRQPLKLQSDMALDDALLTMRIHRHPMAIVLDKQKNFIGIVTIKDIVEEITGEIRSW